MWGEQTRSFVCLFMFVGVSFLVAMRYIFRRALGLVIGVVVALLGSPEAHHCAGSGGDEQAQGCLDTIEARAGRVLWSDGVQSTLKG